MLLRVVAIIAGVVIDQDGVSRSFLHDGSKGSALLVRQIRDVK